MCLRTLIDGSSRRVPSIARPATRRATRCPSGVLPRAVARQSLLAAVRASARSKIRWLRSRAIPLAVAAAWSCTIIGAVRCTARGPRTATPVVVEAPPVTARGEASPPIDHLVPVAPDRCEYDDALSRSAHWRRSGKRCTPRFPPCGGRSTEGREAKVAQMQMEVTRARLRMLALSLRRSLIETGSAR